MVSGSICRDALLFSRTLIRPARLSTGRLQFTHEAASSSASFIAATFLEKNTALLPFVFSHVKVLFGKSGPLASCKIVGMCVVLAYSGTITVRDLRGKKQNKTVRAACPLKTPSICTGSWPRSFAMAFPLGKGSGQVEAVMAVGCVWMV